MYNWIFQEVIDNSAIDFPEPDIPGPWGPPLRWILSKARPRPLHKGGVKHKEKNFSKTTYFFV